MTFHRIAIVLLALWTGSLVTVCGVVAPMVFATLDDRRLAGQIAAQLFFVETWIGVASGALLAILAGAKKVSLERSTTMLIGAAAIAPLASELVLGPLMDAARSAGNMARFGALHGVAALLFGVACVCTLIALWKITRPVA